MLFGMAVVSKEDGRETIHDYPFTDSLSTIQGLAHAIDDGSIDPFDGGNDLVSQGGSIRGAARETIHFIGDIIDRADGDRAAFCGIDEILSPGIDGNPAFGGNYIDEFSRTAERRDAIEDDGDAVAEAGNGQDRTLCGEAILPAANAMEQNAVGVGDDIGVESSVDFGGAEHDAVEDRGEIAFAVEIVAGERAGIEVPFGVLAHGPHTIEIEGLSVEDIVGESFLEHIDEIFGGAAANEASFDVCLSHEFFQVQGEGEGDSAGAGLKGEAVRHDSDLATKRAIYSAMSNRSGLRVTWVVPLTILLGSPMRS